MSVETITPEGLHAVLDDHGPDICESGHFTCDCGWHEPLPEDPTEINSWTKTWNAFIDHLTQPPKTQGGIH